MNKSRPADLANEDADDGADDRAEQTANDAADDAVDDNAANNESADALVARAYALETPEDANALYRDWAVTYDRSMVDELGYLTPQKTAELLQQHCDEPGACILDVGAGTGLAGAHLHQLGYQRLHALDRSAEMLAVAQARGVYQHIIHADLTQPLSMIDDQTYDAMICTGTFTHAHVGAVCLPELFRGLKVGGVLVCTVHHDVWEPAGFARMMETLHVDQQVRTVYQQPGAYYRDATINEGDYLVWQRLR